MHTDDKKAAFYLKLEIDDFGAERFSCGSLEKLSSLNLACALLTHVGTFKL